MSKKIIVLYVLLAVILSLVLTVLTYTTPLGMILYYTSLAFIPDALTTGMGDTGIGIVLYWSLFANFVWGLLPLFLAWRKHQAKRQV